MAKLHIVKTDPGQKPGRQRNVDGPEMSNGQRAFWTFLLCTLVGPLLVGLIVFLITLCSGALQMGPPSLKGLPMAAVASRAGQWAVSSFVWSALPAALAGAVLAAVVSIRGTVDWFIAAAAAIAGFGVASVVTPVLANHNSFLAGIAGLVGVACWTLLVRIRILPR
jgi:hypothetical protein